MAPRSVSEEHRATRAEMAQASEELASTLRLLAVRLFEEQPALGDRLNATAAFFDRFHFVALSSEHIHDVTLRTLGRIYQEISIKVGEARELLDEYANAPRQVVFAHLNVKIIKISDLTCVAIPLVL